MPDTAPKPPKLHREFFTIDFAGDWTPVPGYPNGIAYQTLADDFDETAGRGSRTRLVEFKPGVLLDRRVVHEFWEEVYVVSGDLVVIDPETRAETSYGQHTYACRPPGTPHGPFSSRTGCLLLELHHF